MHIVFLSSEYPLWSSGGLGSFLQTFGHVLVKNGHKATILGIGKSGEEEFYNDKGVGIILMPRGKGILPGFVHNAFQINAKLKEINKKEPFDVIESVEGGLAFLYYPFRIKKVIRLHGGHYFFKDAENRGINWRKGLLEKLSFRKADGFIAVSEYVKNHTENYLSYHKKPVVIINHPIKIIEEKPDLPIKKDHILFAGTVCEKKGVRQLLEAFSIIRETYPDKVLDIYGRDWLYPDGSSYIEKLKNNLGEDYFRNVLFHGNVSREELYRNYLEASFCIFPSHMETQGLVCLEAMMLQKPVIFSKYGPGPETIEHGINGLLCDVFDPKDIADKMQWIIEHPKLAKEMAVMARERIKIKYNERDILKKNIDFYQKLLNFE